MKKKPCEDIGRSGGRKKTLDVKRGAQIWRRDSLCNKRLQKIIGGGVEGMRDWLVRAVMNWNEGVRS